MISNDGYPSLDIISQLILAFLSTFLHFSCLTLSCLSKLPFYLEVSKSIITALQCGAITHLRNGLANYLNKTAEMTSRPPVTQTCPISDLPINPHLFNPLYDMPVPVHAQHSLCLSDPIFTPLTRHKNSHSTISFISHPI